jgi:archaellum biogenesis protein FlaJ (TadC family)
VTAFELRAKSGVIWKNIYVSMLLSVMLLLLKVVANGKEAQKKKSQPTNKN